MHTYEMENRGDDKRAEMSEKNTKRREIKRKKKITGTKTWI